MLALPPGWTSYHGLKAGDAVEVEADGELRVRPVAGLKLRRPGARVDIPVKENEGQ